MYWGVNLYFVVFIFSYDPDTDRCVVPDHDGTALTSTERATLKKETVAGMKYYLFPVEEVACMFILTSMSCSQKLHIKVKI